MSTEIEAKDKELISEQDKDKNKRAKTKIPIQNRITSQIPSTINEDEEQEQRMEEDEESQERRENLQAIMEIGRHESMSEDEVASQMMGEMTNEETMYGQQFKGSMLKKNRFKQFDNFIENLLTPQTITQERKNTNKHQQ